MRCVLAVWQPSMPTLQVVVSAPTDRYSSCCRRQQQQPLQPGRQHDSSWSTPWGSTSHTSALFRGWRDGHPRSATTQLYMSSLSLDANLSWPADRRTSSRKGVSKNNDGDGGGGVRRGALFTAAAAPEEQQEQQDTENAESIVRLDERPDLIALLGVLGLTESDVSKNSVSRYLRTGKGAAAREGRVDTAGVEYEATSRCVCAFAERCCSSYHTYRAYTVYYSYR